MRHLLLVTLLLLTTAAAQGRLNPPNYYLSQLPELTADAQLRGELTEASGQNFKDGTYLDLYVLYGEEGEEVTLRAASLEFDTYLSLFDPAGWLLATGDDSVHGTDAEIIVTLPQEGRYLLVVSGYGPLDLGRYSVSRASVQRGSPAEAITLSVPGSHAGSFDEVTTATAPYLEAPGVHYMLELTEASALAIMATSFDFDTFVLVTDDAGNIVVENDDANYSEVTNWSTDSRAFAEFEAGVYHVYVTSLYGVPVGAYEVSVRRYVAID